MLLDITQLIVEIRYAIVYRNPLNDDDLRNMLQLTKVAIKEVHVLWSVFRHFFCVLIFIKSFKPKNSFVSWKRLLGFNYIANYKEIEAIQMLSFHL